MRPRIASRCCQFAPFLLLLVPSLARAETRTEQGRELLNGVREMRRNLHFGCESLDYDQFDCFCLAWALGTKEDRVGLGDYEPSVDSQLLEVEKLGRDLIAGKPISDANAKILNEYFKCPKDPVTGCRVSDETRRQAEFARQLGQQWAEKLASGQPLPNDGFVIYYGQFRSGDQLTWNTADFPFDAAKMFKVYPSADPERKHAMRMLVGMRGKADEPSVTFILAELKGNTAIERCDAAFAAGQMRPASDKVISALTGCLGDPDPRVARAATRSLLALHATQSAPAMLRHLRSVIGDKSFATLDEKVGFGFSEYNIQNSYVAFRYDLPTELIFALGRFHYRDAAPLLWEIVQGKHKDVRQWHGIGHGAVAAEAILAMDTERTAAAARRILAMESATVDAKDAAADALGDCGDVADVPVLLNLTAKTGDRGSRATFAAERLVYFADARDPRVPAIRQQLVVALRKGVSGSFGGDAVKSLVNFDPEHVETTALVLAADTKAQPNARRIATEILARSKKLRYVEPLLALFEDEGNAVNGPVGLHAAWAVAKILAAADHADPTVIALTSRVADKLERIDRAKSPTPFHTEFRAALLQVDSDRGVRACSRVAIDDKASYLDRSIALHQIAQYAQKNREFAKPLRPLLDVTLGYSKDDSDLRDSVSREKQRFRCAKARRAPWPNCWD